MLFRSLELAEHMGQIGQKVLVSKNGFIEWMPLMLSGWTQTRDLKAMPAQSFRDWWAKEKAPAAKRQSEKNPNA